MIAPEVGDDPEARNRLTPIWPRSLSRSATWVQVRPLPDTVGTTVSSRSATPTSRSSPACGVQEGKVRLVIDVLAGLTETPAVAQWSPDEPPLQLKVTLELAPSWWAVARL